MDKIYGVFDGEYSDWSVRGFFTSEEEAQKYCAVHTDCYIYEMNNLNGSEDLSSVKLAYEHTIVFNMEGDEINGRTILKGTPSMRNEPDRYMAYDCKNKRHNSVEGLFCPAYFHWISFCINTNKPNDRKRCEKIAQDYLASMKGEKGYITKRDVTIMNKKFQGELY